jgi:parallel beta-helix repeat protein
MPPHARALALVAIPLLASGCGSAQARTLSVSTDAQLAGAVAAAKPGDRILLAPGSYQPLRITGRKLSGEPVVLTGKGATLLFVQILNSSGWSLDGLEIGGGFDERGRVLRIENSADIEVRNSLIRGQNMNNDAWDDGGIGIGLRNAERVEIRGNRFRETKVAISAGSSRDIRVAGNSFAYIREGLNWVAVDGGVIRCNRFSHFQPNYAKREHPDALQFWQNNDGSANNTLIEGNFFSLGGPRAVHGIFGGGTQSPEKDPKFRMRNSTIRDNIYYGSALHGISLGGAENTVVERNTVIGSDHTERSPPPVRSADGRDSAALVPKIRIVGTNSSGRIVGNIASSFTIPAELPIEGANNTTAQVRGGGGVPLKKIFLNPPTGPEPPPEAFIVNPASAPGKAGQGARLICGAELPPAP